MNNLTFGNLSITSTTAPLSASGPLLNTKTILVHPLFSVALVAGLFLMYYYLFRLAWKDEGYFKDPSGNALSGPSVTLQPTSTVRRKDKNGKMYDSVEPRSQRDLARECGALAKTKGRLLFGLRDNNKCYSEALSTDDYKKFGPSLNFGTGGTPGSDTVRVFVPKEWYKL